MFLEVLPAVRRIYAENGDSFAEGNVIHAVPRSVELLSKFSKVVMRWQENARVNASTILPGIKYLLQYVKVNDVYCAGKYFGLDTKRIFGRMSEADKE